MSANKDQCLVTLDIVYEFASDIGTHFKKLIEKCGTEQNEELIHCVVKVLEYLELVVSQRDDDILLIEKLNKQIDELQKEHSVKLQQQKKFQSEMEDIDESWRKENVKLTQYIKYLQNENKRLLSLKCNEKCSQSLTDLKNDKFVDDFLQNQSMNNDELEKIGLRSLEKDIQSKNEQIENLTTQNDNLINENQHLRNLVSSSRKLSRSVSEIIVDQPVPQITDDTQTLQAKMEELQEELDLYKMKLKMSEKNLEDTVKSVCETNDNNNYTEDQEEIIKMEDLPVQGPIPKEPDEKLFYNRNTSRIWSFFPRLTKSLIK